MEIEIEPQSQLLHELVELVHVHVDEKLRGEIAEWEACIVSLVQSEKKQWTVASENYRRFLRQNLLSAHREYNDIVCR